MSALDGIPFATNPPARIHNGRRRPGPPSVSETAIVDRAFQHDPEAILAALRIVLGLPRWAPGADAGER